jgi:hypothetical protein
MHFSNGIEEGLGFAGNVLHQMDRGMKWFTRVWPNAASTSIIVEANHSQIGRTGMAYGDYNPDTKVLRLVKQACQISDAILHELAHAVIAGYRGGLISSLVEEQAVEEGVVRFLACRINGHSIYSYPGYPYAPTGAVVVKDLELNKPDRQTWQVAGLKGTLDDQDWSHYLSNDVIASILWDLHKEGVGDDIIWGAIGTGYLKAGEYSPEQFYVALRQYALVEKSKNISTLLWKVFSNHRMNVYAKPEGGMLVNWFEHFPPDASTNIVGYELFEVSDAGKVLRYWPVPATRTQETVEPVSPNNRRFLVRAVLEGPTGKTWSSRARTGEMSDDDEPIDFSIMAANSSYVMGGGGYRDAVQALLPALVFKMPTGSTLSSSEFQKDAVLRYGIARPLGDFAVRLTASSSLVGFQVKDTWFLDPCEALDGGREWDSVAGGMQPQTWRETSLGGSPGPINALSLLRAGPNRRKVGIMVTDWYDSHVQGNNGRDDILWRWAASANTIANGGGSTDDPNWELKNVLLYSGTNPPGGDTYAGYLGTLGMPQWGDLSNSARNARDLFMSAIGEEGAVKVRWDGSKIVDTAALEKLVYCRENLLNEAFQVKPGERMVLPLVLDGSLADADLMVMGAGLSARLYRPDGTEVALEWLGDSKRSRDPTVWYGPIAGGTELYSFRGQLPGTWKLIVDGSALTAPVWGKAMAFGTSEAKLKTDVPKAIRPGDPVTVTAQMADWGSLAEPPQLTFRITRPGDLFAVGNRVVDSTMAATPITDGLTNYSHALTVADVEGRIPYRFLLTGTDKQGNAVSRESSGDFFVKGDEPVIIPLPPAGDEPTEYPVVSAIVADDVKLNTYGIKVDGSAIYPVQATKLTLAEALELLARLTPTLALPPQGHVR